MDSRLLARYRVIISKVERRRRRPHTQYLDGPEAYKNRVGELKRHRLSETEIEKREKKKNCS